MKGANPQKSSMAIMLLSFISYGTLEGFLICAVCHLFSELCCASVICVRVLSKFKCNFDHFKTCMLLRMRDLIDACGKTTLTKHCLVLYSAWSLVTMLWDVCSYVNVYETCLRATFCL